MIHQVISSASSFTGCLDFISESSLPLTGFDVCHLRYPICVIFSSLGVMLRMPTTLHLLVAHDNITRQLANCNENYKFFVYSYSMLQEFIVDNEVIVISRPKIVRKSHTWHTGFPRVL